MCLLWRFVLFVFSMYVCMSVCMGVCIGVPMCAHVYGDLKSTLGVVPQVPSPLLCWRQGLLLSWHSSCKLGQLAMESAEICPTLLSQF